MVEKSNFVSRDSIAYKKRDRFVYPFQNMFSSICNMTTSLYKPPALQHENDALRALINTRKEELERNIRRNKALEELNSTLTERVTALELDSDSMQDSLANAEQRVTTGKEAINEQKEHAERLENQLQETKQKKEELDAELKKEELLMDSEIAEWKCRVEELSQKNHSIEEKLRTQNAVVLKEKRYISNAEADLEQINAIGNLMRSKIDTLKKDYDQMEDENCELRAAIKHLKSEVHN